LFCSPSKNIEKIKSGILTFSNAAETISGAVVVGESAEIVADIMRKRIINFVSQNEVHSGKNLRGKVMIRVFQINGWFFKMKMKRNLMVLISRPIDIDVRQWISVEMTQGGSRRRRERWLI